MWNLRNIDKLEFHYKESSGPVLPDPQVSEIPLAMGHSTGMLGTVAASYIFEFSLALHCISVLLRPKGGLDYRKSSQRAFTTAFDSKEKFDM